MLLGSTPPHQRTLFSPRIVERFRRYNANFVVAADLNYFLSISQSSNLKVGLSRGFLVDIAEGGISGSRHVLRSKEYLPTDCHSSAFGLCPFFFDMSSALYLFFPGFTNFFLSHSF